MTGLPAAQAGASVPLQTSLWLGALPSAVGCARLHARNVMHEWNLPSVAGTVELVVSELVTDAVRASTGPDGRPRYGAKAGLPHIHLQLSSDRMHVLIEVWDQDPRMVRPGSWIRPAGVSPARVRTGAPGSRPRFVAERRRAERGVTSLFGGSKSAGRSVKRTLQPRQIHNGRAEPLMSRRRPRLAGLDPVVACQVFPG